jgi:7,8-dihydroneopterin aldolase/epimerase/oxygenase
VTTHSQFTHNARASVVQSADRLALRGLRGVGHHGVFEHERRDGQEFVVDVELGLDTRPAAAADDLGATVHYGELAERLHASLTTEPVDLIETLAQRLAEICLAEKPVSWVEVTVHKPHAPIAVPFDDVTLTIHRSRDD